MDKIKNSALESFKSLNAYYSNPLLNEFEKEKLLVKTMLRLSLIIYEIEKRETNTIDVNANHHTKIMSYIQYIEDKIRLNQEKRCTALKNRDEIIKISYYIEKYGFEKLIQAPNKNRAIKEIALLMDVKFASLNLYCTNLRRMIKLEPDKLNNLADFMNKNIVIMYNNMSENEILSEIREFLKF